MKVLIKTNLVVNKATKKGEFNYNIVLCKKDLNQLTIKMSSFSGKEKRVVGSINREARVNLKGQKSADFWKYYDYATMNKVTLMLDLVFGVKRDKFPTVNKHGITEFKNNG